MADKKFDFLDISAHQGPLSVDTFKAIKAAGYKGVIIRAGYGNLAVQIDKQFRNNVQCALDAGLYVGAYWFGYAYNVAMAQQEADVFLQIIDQYKGKFLLPVCYDWEYDSYDYAVENGVTPSKALITNMADTFLARVEAAGWYVGNYLNRDYWLNRFDMARLARYDTWYARYQATPEYECGMQQTSSTGRVPEINGNVDTNVAYKDYPTIIRAGGLNGWPKGSTEASAPTPHLAPVPAPQPETYSVKKALSGYVNAGDAAARRNARGTVAPGTYSIYNTASGMINVTHTKGQPGSWINPADNTGAAAHAPVAKPVMREGAMVQYSGPLYADSYGGGKGKTVSGTFRVDIYKPDRKFGAHLPGGWVQQSACKVVG